DGGGKAAGRPAATITRVVLGCVGADFAAEAVGDGRRGDRGGDAGGGGAGGCDLAVWVCADESARAVRVRERTTLAGHRSARAGSADAAPVGGRGLPLCRLRSGGSGARVGH